MTNVFVEVLILLCFLGQCQTIKLRSRRDHFRVDSRAMTLGLFCYSRLKGGIIAEVLGRIFRFGKYLGNREGLRRVRGTW